MYRMKVLCFGLADEKGYFRTGAPADTDGGWWNDSGPDRQISRQQRREGRGDIRRIQMLERELTTARTEYNDSSEGNRARRIAKARNKNQRVIIEDNENKYQ